MARPYPRHGRMHLVTDADRLFAVPLEDFVAERKRLAKELRDGGDREAAAEVAKLPKPTPPAWALNQLAREEPDGDRRVARRGGGAARRLAHPSGALREAMAGHREATRTLVAVVRDRARPGGKPLSEPMLERVRELLQAATVDPEVAERAPARGASWRATSSRRCRGFDAVATSRRRAPRESAAERARPRAKAREGPRRGAQGARAGGADRAELERLIDGDRAGARGAARRRRRSGSPRRRRPTRGSRRPSRRSTARSPRPRPPAAPPTDARDAAATAERELRQLQRQLRNAS